MSRSYKKTPVCKKENARDKRYWNKIVRRTKHVGNYSAYKRVILADDYKIRSHATWQEFIDYKWKLYYMDINLWWSWNLTNMPSPPDEKETWKYYFKYYINK